MECGKRAFRERERNFAMHSDSGGGGGGKKQKKYIFQNGVMMINPEYQSENPSSSPPIVPSSPYVGKTTILPLAIISCSDDLRRANEDKYHEEDNPNEPRPPSGAGSGATKIAEDTPISFSLGTLQAIDAMQHSEYQTAMTRAKEQSLFDGLTEHFVIYEIPIGLISKLILLQDYHLHFMIDDSGLSFLFFFSLSLLSLSHFCCRVHETKNRCNLSPSNTICSTKSST
jgi:hypothetical protein